MIRPLSLADAPELFDLVDANREYLRVWLPWVDASRSKADTLRFVRSSLRDFEAGRGMNCAVEEGGKICGICGFYSIHRIAGAGVIGYWIARSHQGRGLMTQACRELEGIGFEHFGLERIEIHIARENVASLAVARRLGYTKVSTIRDAAWLHGQYVDHLVFSKCNPETFEKGALPRTEF
ncbi:MAG: GNAT family N-acetyltransferase [Desulfobacterales bacterium]|nr:GNAT family N-acetyltransferase [Desulfobacterales bacterium]